MKEDSTHTLNAAWMIKAVNATMNTDEWCFEMSTTHCSKAAAMGMRDLKPQYDRTEIIAMMVKIMAPATGINGQHVCIAQTKPRLTPIPR